MVLAQVRTTSVAAAVGDTTAMDGGRRAARCLLLLSHPQNRILHSLYITLGLPMDMESYGTLMRILQLITIYMREG